MEKLIARVDKATHSRIPEIWQTAIAKEGSRTLEECFLIFKAIHELVSSREAIDMVTRDVVSEFASDGVKYLELRTTPRTLNGLSSSGYISTILKAIDETEREIPSIIVKLLLSIDRTHTLREAEDTVDLAIHLKKEPNSRIVGIDLSGNPNAGDGRLFLPCLQRARESGLKISLHIAEVPNVEESLALLKFNPDRLGHGTCLFPERGGTQELVDYMFNKRIPLEVCLTSNVKCKTVGSYSEHHLKELMEIDHSFALCTDDKGVFSTSLSDEYRHALEQLGLSRQQLWKASRRSIDSTFASDDTKRHLERIFFNVKRRGREGLREGGLQKFDRIRSCTVTGVLNGQSLPAANA
ncbi:adenosine deaminase-like protein isoform X3 [Oscarella lobularis]